MLYELGGMTVVHDASGCNSTYATHDEPRWYRRPAMVYISALTEMDAILGGDAKLVDEVILLSVLLAMSWAKEVIETTSKGRPPPPMPGPW